MALEIRLLPLYQLRVTDTHNLDLPRIELAPSLENDLPHLKQVVISVTGTPSVLADQIQSAYKDWGNERTFNPPVKLSSAARVPREDCRWDAPLPADVSCVLKVKIDYFNSDSTGQADRSAAKTVTAQCILFTPPSPSPSPSPIAPRKRMDEASNIDFPGWLAIDFGTSNSTVTLFDPRLVSSPNDLPREQEQQLRKRFAAWLSQPAAVALPGISATEWEAFIGDINRDLELANARTDPSQLSALFLSSDSARLLRAIRQIELYNGSERFRKAASKRLNQIYHEVFRVPPMQWQSLIPVPLDANRRASEIPSEIEVLSLDEPLQLNMGESAQRRRIEAIQTTKSTTWNEIKARFHHSPKRYFGQDRSMTVAFDGKEKSIPVSKLIQAAWSHLIDLTEDCRRNSPGEFSDGRFNTAVITYPTIAPPVVRREIEQLVSELGIQDIQTAYDEAVSVAIFFLWREFGGDLTLGIESFKTRCRYSNGKWSQNVLVLDIGGGTTDIALIRLTLEEINPFDLGEDQGDGGRYYVLTPRLQGSSGHLQLGGELITLRVFLLLKAAIADCLLSATSAGDLQSDFLEGRLMGLNLRFTDNGRFNNGSLLACLDQESPENDSAVYKDALDTAEQVLPTRWLNASARLQTFYTLWEQAEKAKLKLGQQSAREAPEPFILTELEISELLTQCGIDYQIKNPNRLTVTLSRQQFERAALPVVQEAIGIAKGLMESRLRKQEASPTPQNSEETEEVATTENFATADAPQAPPEQPPPEQVDWLILSGKTCNLDLVKQESYQQFSKSRYFVWNPERITFVPEHTKLATSAGACYAEKLRRLIFDPKESKDLLRRGANQLDIKVKNLFYYLPCAFELKTQDRLLPIFEAGQELYQLNPHEAVAKVRSDRWMGMPLSIYLFRKDFEEMKPQLWGSYSGKALQNRLNLDEGEFRSQIKAQFEVDHTLQFKLLLCRQMPHYWIAADLPSIDLKSALSKPASESESSLIFKDGILCCNIAVNVVEGANAHKTDIHTLVFEGGKDYSSSLNVFQSEDGSCQGLISAPLDNFPKSGKHTFYFYESETDNWVRIGELSRPNVTTEYTCKYYVTLDEHGILRVHTGAVPYWMSEDENCLKQEGCVFKAELDRQPNEMDEKRDPFCGIH
jgi:hypothetical protein